MQFAIAYERAAITVDQSQFHSLYNILWRLVDQSSARILCKEREMKVPQNTIIPTAAGWV